MRCIECGATVDTLYTEYSKDNFRLTQCPACLKFADKYIEFDYVVLTIDVLLLKPQVYRHLLFNTLVNGGGKIESRVTRLGIMLLLFDAYLTWFRVDRQSQGTNGAQLLIHKPVSIQYLYFLALSLVETLVFHLSARLLSRWWTGHKEAGHMVSTALLISSCARLVPVFMVIWEYDVPEAAGLVDWTVIVYNVEALRVLLETGYLEALMIILTSTVIRTLCGMALVQNTLLRYQPGLSKDSISAMMILWRRISE